MYDRARTTLGSSGFEHVFIGEIKNGAVGGFHNWFHWYYLEKKGELNYLGYWETAEFGDNMEVEIIYNTNVITLFSERWRYIIHLHME